MTDEDKGSYSDYKFHVFSEIIVTYTHSVM